MSSEQGDGSESGSRDSESRSRTGRLSTAAPSTMSIGSVCVSGEFDFNVIRTWGENVIQVCSRSTFCAAVDEFRHLTAVREGGLAWGRLERHSLGGKHVFCLRTRNPLGEIFLLQESVPRPGDRSRVR